MHTTGCREDAEVVLNGVIYIVSITIILHWQQIAYTAFLLCIINLIVRFHKDPIICFVSYPTKKHTHTDGSENSIPNNSGR